MVGFLVASIITSQIAARARHQTTQARLRQEETAALNHLNMAVLSVGQAETILDRLVREVAGNLNALTASIYLTEPEAPGQLEPAASFTRPGTPPPEGFRAEIIQRPLIKRNRSTGPMGGCARLTCPWGTARKAGASWHCYWDRPKTAITARKNSLTRLPGAGWKSWQTRWPWRLSMPGLSAKIPRLPALKRRTG